MYVDLSDLLEQSRPPDPELVDLIEQAFLEGQIDGLKADLAYVWLQLHRQEAAWRSSPIFAKSVFVPNLSHGVIKSTQSRANSHQ